MGVSKLKGLVFKGKSKVKTIQQVGRIHRPQPMYPISMRHWVWDHQIDNKFTPIIEEQYHLDHLIDEAEFI